MLTRQELIELLADLAAPLTPFTLEGAPMEGLLFIGWLEQRAQELLRPTLDDAVDAFIDIVSHPPAHHEYIPPAVDESFFQAELLRLAGLYGQTPHAPRILRALEPVLQLPSERAWAIKVLGGMKIPAVLPHLRALARSPLTQEEALSLVDAVGQTGGDEAQALLEELRERCTDAHVQREIDVVLAQLGT